MRGYPDFGALTEHLKSALGKVGWVVERERWTSELVVYQRKRHPNDGYRVLIVDEARPYGRVGERKPGAIQVFCNEPPAWKVHKYTLTPFGHSRPGQVVESFLRSDQPTIVEDLVHLIRTCGLAWVSGGDGQGANCKTCPWQLECLTKEA